MILYMILGVFLLIVSSNCCGPCKCKIIEENMKIAVCSHTKEKLYNISSDIDSEINGLYFTGQYLTKLENNTFVAYNKLQTLLLGMNMIYEIENSAFKNLSSLSILDLSYNKLRRLKSDIFSDTPKITSIQLNNNELLYLPTNLFSNLKYLISINIQKNELVSIQDNCFINLPALYKIDLSSNNLRSLNSNIMDNSNSLSLFDLQDNPWKCDKYRADLQDRFILKKEFIDSAICIMPPQKQTILLFPGFWLIMVLIVMVIFIAILIKYILCIRSEKELDHIKQEIQQNEIVRLQVDTVD